MQRLECDLEMFGVHLVLRDVVDFDREKCPRTYM